MTQREQNPFIGASPELPEEPGLADPRFAHESEPGRPAEIQFGQRVVERFQRLGASNKLLGDHDPSPR